MGDPGDVSGDRRVPRALATFREGTLEQGPPSWFRYLERPGDGGGLRHDVANDPRTKHARQRHHRVPLRPGIPGVVASPGLDGRGQVPASGRLHPLAGNATHERSRTRAEHDHPVLVQRPSHHFVVAVPVEDDSVAAVVHIWPRPVKAQ